MFMKKTGRKFQRLSELEANELRFKQMKEAEAKPISQVQEQPKPVTPQSKIQDIIEMEKQIAEMKLELKKRTESNPKLCRCCGLGELMVDHEYNHSNGRFFHIVKCSVCGFKKHLENVQTTVKSMKQEPVPELEQITGFDIEDSYPKAEYPEVYKKFKKDEE